MPRVHVEEAGDEVDPVCGDQSDENDSAGRVDEGAEEYADAVVEVEVEVVACEGLCYEVE